MKAWWGTYIFITCLWSSVYSSQDLHQGTLIVICDRTYMYSRPEPTYFCKKPAQNGKCNRFFWNDTKELERTKLFLLPRKVEAGWAACVTGAPTEHKRASIELRNNNGSIRLSFDIRMNYIFKKAVTINEGWKKKYGTFWSSHLQTTFYPRPYPFSVGKVFTIKFVAEHNNVVTFYINGKKLVSRRLVHPIHDFIQMEFLNDFKAHVVNLWAQPEG